MLIHEVVGDYIVELRDEGKSWKDIRSQLAGILSRFSHTPAEKLTPRDLEEYRRWRRTQLTRFGRPYEHSSINRELQYLQAALRRALRLDMVREVPRFRMAPERSRRADWCRPEDCQRLLAYLRHRHPPIADVIEFLFSTGWRKREVLELDWQEVDWAQGLIVLPDGPRTKSRKARAFPIQGPVERVLRRRLEARAGPWVFHRHGEPIRCFRRAWRTALRDCELKGLTLHGLARRSFATLMTLAGVPEDVTMELAGWKTPSTFRRYKIVPQGAMRQGLSRFEEYLRTNGGGVSA